jgi:endonuclease G
MREAIRDFLFDPNVNLIEFGHPLHDGQLAEDELAIRLHVHKKLSSFGLEAAAERGQTRPIPPALGGFQTDVIQGTYRPNFLWGWWGNWPTQPTSLRTSRAEVLRGGISISDENHYTYATLGGLVIDRTTGAEMILSNWHVLVGEWGARRGQRILQPGRADGGTNADTVAQLTRDAMTVNLDAAVAALTGSRSARNEQLELGPVRGVKRAELGMELVKSGRSTEVTHARVTAIEGTAKMTYDGVERIVRHVMTIEPRRPHDPNISTGGDSGSWWLDAETKQAIGLHFAGSDYPDRALAHDMPTVLEALNVDIATKR